MDLGREAGGGLVIAGGIANVYRAPIISAAARHNVPAVYWRSDYAGDGGLREGLEAMALLERWGPLKDRKRTVVQSGV